MLKKSLFASFCFLLALISYWAYALAIVPLIEPAARTGRPPVTTVPGVKATELDGFFQEGAWEREQPLVLETEQFFLLFRDYKPDGKNTIQVAPVTLLYFPDDDPVHRIPVIIQAPEGAVIESDREINLSRAIIGKPVRARLSGRVEIRRAKSASTADDELYVSTRDIQIDRKRIWAPHDVEFRFGPHIGRGKDLQIRLHEHDARGTAMRNKIGVVRDLELGHLERLELATGHGFMAKGLSSSADDGSQDQQPQPPVEVRCDGAFRFNFVSQMVSLADNVRLTRQFPEYVDTLNCSVLEIFFRDSDSAKASAVAATSSTKVSENLTDKRLSVDRLIAKGSPVVLAAPSQEAYARAEYVECRYAERRIIVESKRGAWLRHQQTEIEAERLDYTLAPQDNRHPGTLIAEGAGRIRGLSEGSSGQAFEASWGKRLLLRPHEDRHVLQLFTRATVQFIGMGGFSADEIHLYLTETAPPRESFVASSPPVPAAGDEKFHLKPDRLIATGNVLVDSIWLKSKAPSNELKVWFVPEAGVISEAPPEESSAEESSSADPSSAPHSSVPKTPSGPPLEFQGDTIEAKVIDGAKFRLDDMTVAGRVKILRPSTKTGEEPLVISGKLLRISGAGEEQALVEVLGEPAEAGAQGLLLRGRRIVLDQTANLMTIPGVGEMKTAPRLLPAQPGRSKRNLPGLLITWSEGLEFDGLVANFHGQIKVTGSSQFENGDRAEFHINGQEMNAELTRPLNFREAENSGTGSPKVDLATLTFPGEVMLENRTTNRQGGLESWEQMQVLTLRLDQQTGTITAQGPGQLSTVRRGAMGPNHVAPGARATAQLTNVQVHYEGSISGNIAARQVEFFEHVHALYGPVGQWEQRLNPDEPPRGRDAFELRCERLQVNEMQTPDELDKTHFELLARENVKIQGESFFATGDSLKYDDAKAMLILEGRDQEPASIKTNWQNGNARARKISVWHKQKRFLAERVTELDILDVGNLPGQKTAR